MVLLGLDRRHDLAHRSGALGADLGEHRVGNPAGDVGRVRIIEMLVEVRRDFAGVEREPPPQRHAERVGAGGSVERRRDGRPPIDDDGIVLVVLDVPPAEVPPLGHPLLDGVDAPEEVPGAGAAQVGKRLGHRHLDVLGGDLVRRALRIDALEPLDHQITRPSSERQARPFRLQLPERAHLPCVYRSRPNRVGFVSTSAIARVRSRAARVVVT